ncbi:MAG TPA: hypothetical protein VEI02_07810, partial [Planctomycetota bacterium]|nr:hypothetical protein [Planctomycetota bacterium]
MTAPRPQGVGAARDRGPGTLAACALVAALALAAAIHRRDGLYDRGALPWLAAACVAAVLPWIAGRRFLERRTPPR